MILKAVTIICSTKPIIANYFGTNHVGLFAPTGLIFY